MSADAANQNPATAQGEPAGGVPVAKEAPTEQQPSQAGVPKKITNAQTVCNEKNQKGKLCNGHLKQMKTGGEDAEKHLRGDDVLFQCQTCGTLYMGPPLGHVRDPEKQSRFVEKELMGILRAAGGTLPAFKKSVRGTLVPMEEDASHQAPAPAAAVKPAATAAPAAAKPAAPAATGLAASAAPANETPEERKARLIAEAQARKAAAGGAGTAAAQQSKAPPASTSGTDSSAEADRHRPAAEAQAATGQASAAPMSSAASTASPAAGAETVADLAPEASTELTPGAPKDERKRGADQAADSEAAGEGKA
ncbi:MAG TPA: hypothetical protein VF717_02915 [Pyrinomonadaceae bacterium]|jgi:hypothetical protein